MCGICGIVAFGDDPIDELELERMNATLYHRGPDSGGAAIDDAVGLAARRLAIIDLETGDQPIANEDGTITVAQNGEIYNYRELRAELERRGHRFRTAGDTEVIAHLYEEHGLAFASMLRGMFAIAIRDVRKDRLVLARDRYGIKPLYYSLTPDRLAFGSELKALLSLPRFSREIDLDALEAYLAFSCIPAPLTIFRDARKLPAGCTLVCDRRAGSTAVRIEQYASPSAVPEGEIRRESETELAEELRWRLRDSVRAHLVADVPIGVLLSGGIDSSALTALATLEGSGTVSTFSIGFDEPDFDERSRARLVAARYGTDHHELVVRPDAVSLMEQLTETFDEPFADSSAVPTYLVSELARRHVKVVMSGEGGDELFGGYNYYVGHQLAPYLGWAAGAMRPVVERLPTSTSRQSSIDYKLKQFVRGASQSTLERHYAWKDVFTDELRAGILTPELQGGRDPIELLRPTFDASRGSSDLARVMDLDLNTFLVEDMLVKTDRASMAHSLEVRVPFLDTTVTDFALALPMRHKLRGSSKKRLLRRAIAPYVPDEVVNGVKSGFSIPVAAWLRNELAPMTRDILSPAAVRRQGIFAERAVTSLIEEHATGKADRSRQIWSLLTFALWFDRYADGGVASGASAPRRSADR